MVTYANITPTAPTDGIVYANAVPLTPTEADLYGGTGANSPDPIPISEGQTIFAIVKVTINGQVNLNNSYIFLQTDLGDGTWVDIAWCQIKDSNISPGIPKSFVLSGGGIGSINNAFAQRQAGSAPATQGNGSNQFPLGGRVRFSGFSGYSQGSSSVAGTTAGVQATITYRIQEPR